MCHVVESPKCEKYVWRPDSARTRWGSFSAPPDPLAAIGEGVLLAREKLREGEGKERKGERDERGGEGIGKGQSWGLESETIVRLESLFSRLATYLRLALKDLRLDLRLEHKDLRLTRDSTLTTRDLVATCKSLCYSRVVIKDELGNICTFVCCTQLTAKDIDTISFACKSLVFDGVRLAPTTVL